MFACLQLLCLLQYNGLSGLRIILKIRFFMQQSSKINKKDIHRQCCWKSRHSHPHTSFQRGLDMSLVSCLCASGRHWFESRGKGGFCGPTALSVWLLQVEWGATKVVSHCYTDRYSNYILLHSVPISIQHQHTPLKLHYTLAKWNKSLTFNGFGSQKETLTPSGVRHQIVSWSRRLQNTYDF